MHNIMVVDLNQMFPNFLDYDKKFATNNTSGHLRQNFKELKRQQIFYDNF